MVRALIVLLFLLLSPVNAYAEDVPSDTPVEQLSTSSDVLSESDSASDVPIEQTITVDVDSSPLYSEDGLLVSSAEEPVAASANASLPSSVYGSVTPNQSYASFAANCSLKIPWCDDYVFFRGAANEFWLVYGDLDISDGLFLGTDCHFIRWYYSDSSRQYEQESGTGSLSLDVGGYIVMSNLGDYPVLDSTAPLVLLVCWIACVAVAMRALGRMWSMLIRMGVRVCER